MGMLFTRLPQVRFPARLFAIDKTPDDILTEELDKVGGYASSQFCSSTILEATAFTCLAHCSALDQYQNNYTVAGRMSSKELFPVQVTASFLGWV